MMIPDSRYYPELGISHTIFQMCNLYPLSDRYSSEDAVEGTIGKTKIRFAEVTAQNKGKKQKELPGYITIFSGIFFQAEFNKHFTTQVIIKSKGDKNLLRSINH